MQTKLTAVLVAESEFGRTMSVTEVCAELGISRETYYVYRRRFQADGLEGVLPRSRRPRSSPNRLGPDVHAAVVAAFHDLQHDGWDNGAISIRSRLLATAACDPVPSLRSIHRILHQHELRAPQPRKRTRASFRRFEFAASNDCWQIDAFDHALADGTTVVVFEVIDDHSRALMATVAWPSEDGAGAWTAVSTAIEVAGQPPLMVLSDNSLAFSGARRGRRVQFETNLHTLGIKPITARPYRPTTCGKNERHHQTSQRWLRARPAAATITDLQTQLDDYRHAYNTARPHQGIGMLTPAARYEAARRTDPTAPLTDQHRPPPDPPTVVTDHTASTRGQIFLSGTRIGLGSQWAGTRLTSFRTGHHVLVFHRDTLVRELTIDPTRKFQPTGRPTGGTRRPRITDTVT